MDAEWAALNAAQQAALIVWFPVAFFLMFRMVNRSFARNWPMPLVFAGIMIFAAAGAVMIILVLGSVPK